MKIDMINLTIDGKEFEIEPGATVLQAARKQGLYIPTLCYNEAIEPQGACRLCIVEVEERGRTRTVVSCAFPAAKGLIVRTSTPEIVEHRKLLAELLLARCSENKQVIKLAASLGVTDTPFEKTKEDCVLCGLCVQMCHEWISVGAINFSGRGAQRKVGPPYGEFSDVCITCGACERICPTDAITAKRSGGRNPIPYGKDFERNLATQGNVDILFPSAVPLMPAINRGNCLRFQLGEHACGMCAEACGPKAIDFYQQDTETEIEVGAIVLSPGLDLYEPKPTDELGFGRYPNVVTSIQFERMLSATGPFQGEVVKLNDHHHPKKIAWLQCIGSRDVHPGANPYCSSVCCTYAIKQAMMAKDHVRGLDAAIFFIDIRTFGKDFEAYYNRARKESGIRFIKSKLASMKWNEGPGTLSLGYANEEGLRRLEDFDLVVLSVGMSADPGTTGLCQLMNLPLDDFSLPVSTSFQPVETMTPGIMVCGALQAPKDIPSSVIDASAAAGVVGTILSDSRWSLTRTKVKPPETDIAGVPPRVGVFVCRCGTNIAGVVDVPSVVEYAKKLPYVVHVEENLFTCSQDSQKLIGEVIKNNDLNRVVVAACTPRTHEPIFQETLVQAGLNKYLFEMANIRNHCSWVHNQIPALATAKSKDLVRMAVAKAAHLSPLAETIITVIPEALVVGGGLAGMTAAKNLAEQGFKTHLVEQSATLGGQAANIWRTWKDEDVREALSKLIEEVKANGNIKIYLESKVKQVDGAVGQFKTIIATKDGDQVIEHGAAIIATGASEHKPASHLYGLDDRVLTGLDLDKRFMTRPESLKGVKSATFIQCVGSRIPERPYCSKVCCTHSVLSAIKLKELNPKMDVSIVYRDLRTYGLRENLYRQARLKGVKFIRFQEADPLDVKADPAGLAVIFTDYVIRKRLKLTTDLVVLATAIVPPKESVEQIFKVPRNADGFFLEAHVKLRPVDFATDGVFVCGLAHAPKPIDETIAQAQAAAARAVTILGSKGMAVGGVVAEIAQARCTGCSVCVQVCPYQAIKLDDKNKAVINETVCKGCGTCAASCRSGAAGLRGFSNAAVFAQIMAC